MEIFSTSELSDSLRFFTIIILPHRIALCKKAYETDTIILNAKSYTT